MPSLSTDQDEIRTQWRRDAEASYDEWERRENPANRAAWYLKWFEIIPYRLFTIVCAVGARSEVFEFHGREFFVYKDVCIGRIEASLPADDPDPSWRTLWESLKSSIARLENWSGDPLAAAHLSGSLFVSSVILHRAYEGLWPPRRSDFEISFQAVASLLPIPIDPSLALSEQVQLVAQNLQWVDEQLRLAELPPRWW